MAKLPEPPDGATLRRIGAEVRVLPAGTPLARIFFRGGEHPASWSDFRHWGPALGRFDHHLPPGGPPGLQDRGILYVAGRPALGGPDALTVCTAEVFQSTRIVDRTGRGPWFAVFATSRDLGLLDLTGLWPTRAGASAAIATGSKTRTRRWSVAIHDAFPQIDGLLYRSSMAAGEAVALYERAEDAMPTHPSFHRALADPILDRPLAAAAARIGYALL